MSNGMELVLDSNSMEKAHLEIQLPQTCKEHHRHSPQLKFSCSRVCSFANEEHDSTDSAERSKSKVKLLGLIIFYSIVMIVEVVGGMKANSLAVLTDAAHLLTDIAGFFISLFAVGVAGWASTPQQSFGFSRLEVLGALISVQLIWLISGILIYDAVNRILHKNEKVDGGLMFAIAAFGFLVNFVMIVWLGHDHSRHFHSHESHHACGGEHHDHETQGLCSTTGEDHLVPDSQPKMKFLNINIQGAYLHVMTDLIQSIGVMIAGFIIWLKPDWLIVDLLCTLVFAVFALSTTIPMLKSIFCILMETTPAEIDIVLLESGLKFINGVHDVHDLHVWSITSGKFVLASHIVIGAGVDQNEILHNVRGYCEKTFRIHHTTIQIEQEA